MKNLEHTNIRVYAANRKITFGSKLVVFPLMATIEDPVTRIVLGIEMQDGSAVVVAGREIAELREVLTLAERSIVKRAN